MRLPEDNDQWTGRHLDRVEAALWRAFDKYERLSGVKGKQDKADEHYRDYERLMEQVENLRIVLNMSPVLYP